MVPRSRAELRALADELLETGELTAGQYGAALEAIDLNPLVVRIAEKLLRALPPEAIAGLAAGQLVAVFGADADAWVRRVIRVHRAAQRRDSGGD